VDLAAVAVAVVAYVHYGQFRRRHQLAEARARRARGRLPGLCARLGSHRHCHRVLPRLRHGGGRSRRLGDWFTRYSRAGAEHKFPPLLIVLAGKKKAALDNRAADVFAGIRTLRGVYRRELAVGVTALT
jgi:hypothetical protein